MSKQVPIIGGGPAGLFAAEYLAEAGFQVQVFERMPTLGRKFLMAGRGGLNLTHSEDLEAFLRRYRQAEPWLAAAIEAFPPDQLRAWADGLEAQTFTGSSGRVFPKAMKASPLLRAWRARLDGLGVRFHLRHRWTGWEGDQLCFLTQDGSEIQCRPDAVFLALGGASWPRLGSDGAWADSLAQRGVEIASFQASNCGVEIHWSEMIRTRFAGAPLKTIALHYGEEQVRGEAIIASYGLEGGAVYALSAPIREGLAKGEATLRLDLRPNQTREALAAKLARARKGQSISTLLKKTLGLSAQAAALVHENGPLPREPEALAARIKAVDLTITGQRGLDRAISSAGGITRAAVSDDFMLKTLPGVFVAGEMLDWDAPTGGYLLQACFSTARAAAQGIQDYLSAAS